MKILLISPLPPPVGGIATWTKSLISYFQSDSSDQVELFHVDSSIGRFSITNSSMFVRVIRGVWISLKVYARLLRILIFFKPEIVHLTSSGSLALFRDLLILCTCKIFNVKTVVHFHYGRIPEVLLSKSTESRLLEIVAKFCDAVVVLDKNSYSAFRSKGIGNCNVIGNPIPSDFERRVRSNQKKHIVSGAKEAIHLQTNNNRKQHVIFVGHVKPAKGVFELINAMRNSSASYQIDFIGPYESEIKERLLSAAFDLGVAVAFYGSRDRNYIFNAINTSSILVLPSYTEGFPNVLLEALAVGCPVVSTSVGAIPDIVSETLKTGLIVEPRDINALRDALFKLLDDHELRKEYGRAGQEYVFEHYSTEVIYKKHLDLWNRLIRT